MKRGMKPVAIGTLATRRAAVASFGPAGVDRRPADGARAPVAADVVAMSSPGGLQQHLTCQDYGHPWPPSSGARYGRMCAARNKLCAGPRPFPPPSGRSVRGGVPMRPMSASNVSNVAPANHVGSDASSVIQSVYDLSNVPCPKSNPTTCPMSSPIPTPIGVGLDWTPDRTLDNRLPGCVRRR